jgi:hypothetical protein
MKKKMEFFAHFFSSYLNFFAASKTEKQEKMKEKCSRLNLLLAAHFP